MRKEPFHISVGGGYSEISVLYSEISAEIGSRKEESIL